MNEADYWVSLEFRVTAELAGIEQCQKLSLWCDGVTPASYEFQPSGSRIRGTAWICPGSDQQEWQFTLTFDGGPTDRESVDWQALLPQDDVTHWLVLDFAKRHIEIEPRAAITDLS